MKVSRVEITPYVWQLPVSVTTARGTYFERSAWRVALHSDDGRVGWGEAAPLDGQGTESLQSARDALGAAERMLPGLEVPAQWQSLEEAAFLPRTSPGARYAIELALLDLMAQRVDRPIAGMLAQDAAFEIRVNGLLAGTEIPALVAEAQLAVDAGYQTLKMKVGVMSPAQDVERVNAVRNGVGPNVRLRIDANGVWSLPLATQMLQALEGAQLELAEQPVSAAAWSAWSELRLQTQTPLAADESLREPHFAQALWGDGARKVDFVVLKPMLLGGLLPSLAIARNARRAGVEPIVTHSWDGAVGQLGALHLAAALRCSVACGLSPDTLALSTSFREGRLSVPRAPGLGYSGDVPVVETWS